MDDEEDFQTPGGEPNSGITLEAFQEKLDNIEVLQSQLDKERDKLHQYEKRVADLTEELAISQANLIQAINKLNQISQERDQYQIKLKDSINRMS